VDRCCDFRGTLNNTVHGLPNTSVVQDFAHLKNRIMGIASKKSSFRSTLSSKISSALVQTSSNGKLCPAQYWPLQEQLRKMQEVWNTFQNIRGLWTEDAERTFKLQMGHIEKGCLQRCHPFLPSHTSGNENLHRRINNLTKGDTSSLPTVISLLSDSILRFNIRIESNLSQPADSVSRRFRAAAKGSPHIFLLHDILQARERLTGIQQPYLHSICSTHHFGLVYRQNS
jgi:hypothetical protein